MTTLTTRQPASVNTFGSVTVLWQGSGNYQQSPTVFGCTWQLTTAPEGAYNCKWLAMPIDALETSIEARPGYIGARN